MKDNLKGILYTLSAGIAWGLSGTCGQYLMAVGFPPLVLTAVRLLIAGVFLAALSYGREKAKLMQVLKEPKTLLLILFFSLMGLLSNQFSYLMAIRETNAGTATVIQYLCPVIVLAYSCWARKKWPTRVEFLTILSAVVGTFLIATHGQIGQLAITPLGLFWGLLAAFSYASYLIFPLNLIKRLGSGLFNGLGMLFCGLAIFPFSQSLTFAWPVDGPILLALFGLIGMGTIFTYTIFLAGTSLIGPVKASLIASIEPISAVFFAFLIMGDHFYSMDLLGMALILGAVLTISYQDLKHSS